MNDQGQSFRSRAKKHHKLYFLRALFIRTCRNRHLPLLELLHPKNTRNAMQVVFLKKLIGSFLPGTYISIHFSYQPKEVITCFAMLSGSMDIKRQIAIFVLRFLNTNILLSISRRCNRKTVNFAFDFYKKISILFDCFFLNSRSSIGF
jgi:hypothetical protein